MQINCGALCQQASAIERQLLVTSFAPRAQELPPLPLVSALPPINEAGTSKRLRDSATAAAADGDRGPNHPNTEQNPGSLAPQQGEQLKV